MVLSMSFFSTRLLRLMTEADGWEPLVGGPDRAGVEEPLEPLCWVTGERPSVLLTLAGAGSAGFRGLCLAGPG